jgi:formate hydrogenlyase subunit 3/multisubunit Na+/H+ antiporter MnhD subunit
VHSVAFSVFGVDWEFFKPYIVIGLATGGAYALSGVGIVVLYQATGVLNLAFGAIGAVHPCRHPGRELHAGGQRADRVRHGVVHHADP